MKTTAQNHSANTAPSSPARAPTLADVARRAGVSTATVSRCLNTPDQVIDLTRKRVQQAIQELGYAPNFSARALAVKQTKTIGAVIPTMENAIFARGLQAFQEELGAQGYTMLVASSAYQETLEAEQIRTLVARGADALLLIGYHRDSTLYDFLSRRGVPSVVAWSHDADQPHPAIGFDNIRAMRDLTDRVIAQGHRHLAMISAPIASNDRARDRVTGARAALNAAGLPGDAMPVIETDYDIETGATACQQLMRAHPQTTAILCGNDVLAVGALRGAKAMGLSVPRDLSITGFDDLELSRLTDPALTTVHVPHREMGRRAAQILLAQLNPTPPGTPTAPGTALRQELPVQVQERASLGPAPVR